MFLSPDLDSRTTPIASGPIHRLFFALYPPTEIAAGLEALTRSLSLDHLLVGPRVPRERLHVSLNHVGSARVLPQQVVARARAAASSVRARPFTVQFDRTFSFKNDVGLRPFVLGGDDGVLGVQRLHSAVHSALADAGLGPRHEPQHEPHLTLMRAPKEAPKTYLEPVRWTVDEFLLIDSPFGASRHDILGRFALRA